MFTLTSSQNHENAIYCNSSAVFTALVALPAFPEIQPFSSEKSESGEDYVELATSSSFIEHQISTIQTTLG